MANRPVFKAKAAPPYFETVDIEFVYNGGFAASQKQKNITAIHSGYGRRFPEEKILEISSKSMQDIGVPLSAFHLQKLVPSLGKSIPVENVFQGAKKFASGGPYTDLYDVTPKEAKRDERLKTSGRLTEFCFEGESYPLEPKTAFYDWIYINALLENKELSEKLLEYDAFTDIEFNPEKSINCQAKAAAVFVALSRRGLINQCKCFSEYTELFNLKYDIPQTKAPKAPVVPEKPLIVFNPGDIISHKIWGDGTVVSAQGVLTVLFESVGEKKLGIQWVIDNCKVK